MTLKMMTDERMIVSEISRCVLFLPLLNFFKIEKCGHFFFCENKSKIFPGLEIVPVKSLARYFSVSFAFFLNRRFL